ncbi:MAG: UvrABC system protein C [Syntrophaceae bacterium PtaU1.Bin231]|nr:MAG: UvrABC system protein C [Syntrophaceae bacterium PtaU1.Bin231]
MTHSDLQDRLDRIRETIKLFPTTPGLYFMKAADDTVLYIGKAVNLRSRVASYFQPSSDLLASRGPKIVEMIDKVQTVDYLETPSEVEAILQEARLIKDIRPPYNTDLVDDKTFPYLEITTREEFPGVYITRNPKSRRSRLFGPFTAVRDLRAVMVVLQKIFRFRTCGLEIRNRDDKRRFFRPCLLFSIHQCTAPCTDRISKDDYRKIIRDLIQFLQSKRSTVLRQLHQDMEEASKRLDFETAATCRDRIRWIESLDRRGTVEGNVQPEVFAGDPTEAVEQLQRLFESDQPVRVIEGFDIAHIGGSETVGSMVQFIDGKPQIKVVTSVALGGLAHGSKLKTGRMTLACLAEDDAGYRMHIVTGEGKTPPQWVEMGCPLPPWPSVKFFPDAPVRKILDHVQSQHFAMTYGNWVEELTDLCRLLGITAILDV